MAFVQGVGEGERDTWGIGGKEVKEVIEGLVRKIWTEVKGVDVGEFRVMPYQIAMDVVSGSAKGEIK